MFEKYNIKFYKDIKFLNDYDDNLYLLFSHYNKQKCQEDSLHYTSIMYQEVRTEYDVIENLYNTNDKIEDGIILDLNPYKDNLFGKKAEYMRFSYISPNITLIDPLSNNKTEPYYMYETTSFYLELSSFNKTCEFSVFYTLYLTDTTDNDWMYNIKSINNYRLRQLIEEKSSYINIKLSNQITDEYKDELYSICEA